MDTRYWGPSGWELFHLIAFKSPHPDDVLNQMKDVLPCKYCRASTTQYVHDHPLRGDPGKWLYDIHNMVNNKLRTQCADDPKVVDPGPDPKFEQVKAKYMAMKPTKVPGADFLMAVAYNFKPERTKMATQRTFMHALAKVFPFDEYRAAFGEYIKEHEVALSSQRAYLRWMYGLLRAMGDMPSYQAYVKRVAYYKSGCSKKNDRSITCRKQRGGKRDHHTTRRVVLRGLLAKTKS
jgi:hypothetical protein